MRCIKLHVSFRKRSTEYRARLRKMTYADKTSYGTSPPCTSSLPEVIDSTSASERAVCNACDTQCAVHATYRSACNSVQCMQHTARSRVRYRPRTAAHCSKLQHTAAHCNTLCTKRTMPVTLRLAATHCNMLQRTALHCITLHHTGSASKSAMPAPHQRLATHQS